MTEELKRNAPHIQRRGKLASQHPKLSLSGRILKLYRLILRVNEFDLTYKTLSEKMAKQRKPRFLHPDQCLQVFEKQCNKQNIISTKKVNCQRIILSNNIQNLHNAFIQMLDLVIHPSVYRIHSTSRPQEHQIKRHVNVSTISMQHWCLWSWSHSMLWPPADLKSVVLQQVNLVFYPPAPDV